MNKYEQALRMADLIGKSCETGRLNHGWLVRVLKEDVWGLLPTGVGAIVICDEDFSRPAKNKTGQLTQTENWKLDVLMLYFSSKASWTNEDF